jgi:hypothetical protein
MCRLDRRTCTPHHTVAGRSSISLTQSPFPFPSATAAAHPLPATCRAVPLHPYALASLSLSHAGPCRCIICTRAGWAAHIFAHCAMCTACAPLYYTYLKSFTDRSARREPSAITCCFDSVLGLYRNSLMQAADPTPYAYRIMGSLLNTRTRKESKNTGIRIISCL